MSTLRWLHLSDLHMNQIGTETENIREGLLSYLKRRDMTFDYIFISGDLFYAPKKGNRVDICSYINELLKITRTSKEKLFIVPGNHDVDRDCQERLQAIKEISEEYTSSEGIISDEKMILLSEGKTAYIEQMLQIYNDVPDRCQLYEDRVHPHFCVTTDDLNIIHVDTTLTYSEEKNRDFFIGTHHLKKVLEKIDDHKATIVLTHYPLNYLMQDERKQIEKLLADHNIQLWLAGHEHNELIGGEESIHVFLAGNLMHEQNARSLILTGEINTTTGKGKLEAHYWCSPRDWTKYTTLWRNKNEYCDIYPFELQNYSYKEDVKETCLRKISDGVYAVNLFELEERHFKDISEEDFKEIKA